MMRMAIFEEVTNFAGNPFIKSEESSMSPLTRRIAETMFLIKSLFPLRNNPAISLAKSSLIEPLVENPINPIVINNRPMSTCTTRGEVMLSSE